MKIGTEQVDAHVDTLYIEETYVGLLFGMPTVGMNDGKLSRLPDYACEKVGSGPFRWEPGGAKAVVIDPKRHALSNTDGGEMLPNYTIMVSLSAHPLDGKSCASMCVVAFLREELNDSLENMIEEECREVVWKDAARDFDY
jgi:hypothetical protein